MRLLGWSSLAIQLHGGEGLAESEKYSTLVQRYIEEKQKVVVEKKCFAHCGATIGYSLLSSDDNDKKRTCGERIQPGEVPTAFPTVKQQVKDFPDDPRAVDLILITAGINDVGIGTILDPFAIDPLASEREVRRKAEISCHDEMVDLLKSIDEKFDDPKTKIVVTDYFRLVTEESDITKLIPLGIWIGIPTSALLIFGIDAAINLGLIALARISFYKDLWTRNWNAFSAVSLSKIYEAVTEVDKARGKFLFAHVGFSTNQALGAADSAFCAPFLKIGGEYIGLISVEDSVKSTRLLQCNQSDPKCTSPHCPVASIGHPNPKGATRYATAIILKLFPPSPIESSIPPQCRYIAESIEGLKSERTIMQEELNSATSATQKAYLANRINIINNQINKQQNDLQLCISGSTPKPTYVSLGGTLTSAPAIGNNSNGTLEVFARGTDNALYHIWQTSPGGGWSGWAGLGGTQLVRQLLVEIQMVG